MITRMGIEDFNDLNEDTYEDMPPSAKPTQLYNLCSGTAGAIGELTVSTDLMKLGHEVFRSLSPNASCDLIVIARGSVLRVEVRTGEMCEGANRPSCSWDDLDRQRKAEILAVVCYSPTRIYYLLPGTGTTPSAMKEFNWS